MHDDMYSRVPVVKAEGGRRLSDKAHQERWIKIDASMWLLHSCAVCLVPCASCLVKSEALSSR